MAFRYRRWCVWVEVLAHLVLAWADWHEPLKLACHTALGLAALLLLHRQTEKQR